MKRIIPLFTFTLFLHLSASAALPQKWDVELAAQPPQVFTLQRPRGETYELEAVLKHHGKPFAPAITNACIYWQTNGMANLYWSAPASVSNNVLQASWLPSMDPGATSVRGYIGDPGRIYAAAFQFRFIASPGADPNALPLPTPFIDFENVRVLNPPWPTNVYDRSEVYTKAETDARIEKLPLAGITNMNGRAVGIADGNRTAYGDFASAIDNGASVGYRASAGDKGVAIGASSTNTSWGSVAIGFGAQAAKGSVAIGHSDDNDGVPVRDTARAGDYAVAIGTAAATGIRSVSIGQDSKTERDYSVAIGASGQKTNRTSMNYDTAVGALAKTEGSNSEGKIAIGYNATASESRIVQIGNNANSKYADPTKIGFGNKTLSQILEGAESDPIAKELANAAQSTADAADAKANSALVYASGVYQYMNGNTNAWFEGTNYPDRVTVASKVKFAFEPGMDLLSMPCSMALFEIRDGERRVVWDQRDWIVWYWNFKSAQASNAFARVTGAIADEVGTNCMKRGWAKYTAVRGLDNPDPSTLWIDTPKVQLMAGHQWEKLVELGGAGYWTLTGNGVQIAPQDAESTFLTIKDFEGNAYLTFRKTSSYLVYCKCGTDIVPSFYDSQGRVVFHLTTDVQPTAEFSTILEDTSFVEQDEEGCPANCEWTGSSGSWDCHFLLKPGISSDACFARFKILREGENVVEYTIPIKIDGGIVFDFNGQTIKCRPVPTGTSVGSTVNWVVAQ